MPPQPTDPLQQPDAVPTPPSNSIQSVQPQVIQPVAPEMPTVPQPDVLPPITPPPAPVEPPQLASNSYSSNPFKAVAKGLGRVLTFNPISSLTVGLIAILVILVTCLVCGLLAVVLGDPLSATIVVLLGILIVILVVLRSFAATIVIHDAGMSETTITSRQAFGKMNGKQYTAFVVVTILQVILTLIGLIVLIIPGLIIGSRLALAPFAIFVEGLGPKSALGRSWRLTKGHTWEMIGTWMAQFMVIGFSGGLLTLIGAEAGFANRYYELAKAEKAGQSTGKTHWMNYLITVLGLLIMAGYVALIIFIHQTEHRLNPSSSINYSLQGSNSTSNSTSNSNKDYCYFASIHTMSATCTDKVTCLATTACAQLYGLDSSSSSSTDVLPN